MGQLVGEFRASAHSEMLRRVFDIPGRGMSKALADSILEMDFTDEDASRIAELNERANEGLLTPEEDAQLEAYVSVGQLLAYWQSKARQVLRPMG